MNKWLIKLINHPEFEYPLTKIALYDKTLYEKYIKETEYETNVWSGNFTYLWAHNFSRNVQIFKTFIGNMLVSIVLANNGRIFLPSLPFGKGNPDHLLKILISLGEFTRKWNKENNLPSKSLVNPLNAPQVNFLNMASDFAEYFRTEKLSGLERHYSIKKVLKLQGKEFGTIRSKLNRFKREYPETIIRFYHPYDYQTIMTLGHIWEKTSGKKYKRIFDHFYFAPIVKHCQTLDHIILLVELHGKIIGMTSGEVLPNNTAWGCMTKFDDNYHGISEKLTVEMIKEINKRAPDIETINVGSDLGNPGLAFYKERYRPVLNYERFALFFAPK